MSKGQFINPVSPSDPSVFSPHQSDIEMSIKKQFASPSPFRLGQNKRNPQSPPDMSRFDPEIPFQLRTSKMIPIQTVSREEVPNSSRKILHQSESQAQDSPSSPPEPGSPTPSISSMKEEDIFGEREIHLVKLKENEVLTAWVRMWIVILVIFDISQLSERQFMSKFEKMGANLTIVLTVALVGSYFWLRKNPKVSKICITLIAIRYFPVFFRLWGQVHGREELQSLSDSLDLAVSVYRFNLLMMMHFLNIIFLYRTTEIGWDRQLTIGGIGVVTIGFICLYYYTLLTKFLQAHKEQFAQIMAFNFILLVIIVTTLSMSHRLNLFQLKLIKEQKKETRLYNRMVDSIKDAMLVVQDSNLTFKNHQAAEILQDADSGLLHKPIFHVFSEGNEQAQTSSDTLTKPGLRTQSTQLVNKVYSIDDIIKKKASLLSSTVFTLRPEFANCASMDKMNEILASIEKEEKTAATKQFNFFLINLFFLEQEGDNEAPEAVVQLIDISEKILVDSLNSERKYMAYMNSTVSHEMRNPLNSISSQIQLLQSLFSDLSELKQGLSPAKVEALEALASQSRQSMRTCLSSCRILTFTVEDILALPQLKDGKFTKNIQQISLASAAQEIMNILELQAKSKSVQLKLKLSGFSSESEADEHTSARVPLDEKRFQQVLLNYVSNALKFTKKRQGKICIVLQKVEPGDESQEEAYLRSKVEEFYGFDLLAASSQRDFLFNNYQNNDRTDQLKADSPYSLLEPSDRSKVVLTVLDNGVGIKDEDKSKLFKLFGCLKSTRSMNTQGIGLGLVITKMITEEFGGETKVFSQYELGAAFQSSFELVPPDEGLLLKPTARALDSENEITGHVNYKQLLHHQKLLQMRRCLANLSAIQADPEGFQYSTKKILIVDDEPFNCQALLSIFTVLKLEQVPEVVDIALSGQEALNLVKENIRDEGDRPKISYLNKDVEDPGVVLSDEYSDAESDHKTVSKPSHRLAAPRPGGRLVCDYSLILTDCSMPFMDGYELSAFAIDTFEQFGIEERERPAIVAVTGHVESEFQKKAVRAGMKQVHSKPISVGTVARLLLEHRMKFKIPVSLEKELQEEAKAD